MSDDAWQAEVASEENVHRAARDVLDKAETLELPLGKSHAYVLARASLRAARPSEQRRKLEEANEAAQAAWRKRISPRRLQVLRLATCGLSNKEIAEELGLKENTVRTHMRLLSAQLKARSRAQAVALGFAYGILVTGDVRLPGTRPESRGKAEE